MSALTLKSNIKDRSLKNKFHVSVLRKISVPRRPSVLTQWNEFVSKTNRQQYVCM